MILVIFGVLVANLFFCHKNTKSLNSTKVSGLDFYIITGLSILV